MEPKKNERSPEAPSQAAVGQPDFAGISPRRVISDAGDSFKRFMKSHTKTLIKQMITKKIIKKPIGKVIKSQENSLGLDMLLGTMKKMSLEEFVTYLRLLLTISKSEEQETDAKMGVDTGAKKSPDVKTTCIKDDTKELMRIMKGSLEAMKPTPGSELHTVITDFVSFVSPDGNVQTIVSQYGSVQNQTTVCQDDCVKTVSQDDSVQNQTTAFQDGSDQTIFQDDSVQNQTTAFQDSSDQTIFQDGGVQSQTTLSQDDDCVQTVSQDDSVQYQTTAFPDGSVQTISQDVGGGVQSQTTLSQDDDCVQTVSQDDKQCVQTVSQDDSVQNQTTAFQDGSVQTISQDGSDKSQTTVSQDSGVQSRTIVSQHDGVQTVSDDSDQSQTTAQQLDVDLPPKPPKGHLGNPVSRFFTKEGGTLYSPLHGVTVIIPPNAVPGAIPTFFLSMHFYLLQPFTLMDDADPCSVIVWLHQNPHFHFLEEVTVKIPHAAIVDDSLCVLTWGKGGKDEQLNLNTEVPADFSDGYHAVIKVKHFCPKVTAKRRNPRRKCTKKQSKNFIKKMEKLKSNSLETSIGEDLASLTNSTEADPNSRPLPRQDAMECDSPAVPVLQDSPTTEENESGVKYSIACSMPCDRSRGDWKVQFAACQSNPTGISVS